MENGGMSMKIVAANNNGYCKNLLLALQGLPPIEWQFVDVECVTIASCGVRER